MIPSFFHFAFLFCFILVICNRFYIVISTNILRPYNVNIIKAVFKYLCHILPQIQKEEDALLFPLKFHSYLNIKYVTTMREISMA